MLQRKDKAVKAHSRANSIHHPVAKLSSDFFHEKAKCLIWYALYLLLGVKYELIRFANLCILLLLPFYTASQLYYFTKVNYLNDITALWDVHSHGVTLYTSPTLYFISAPTFHEALQSTHCLMGEIKNIESIPYGFDFTTIMKQNHCHKWNVIMI